MAAQAPLEQPPLIDLDASPVQGQLASAVLDLKGQMVRGQLDPRDADVLYKMLIEVGTLREPTFRRLTVTYPTVRYIVARDEMYVYIVQTRAG
jgi:hypothetical protein